MIAVFLLATFLAATIDTKVFPVTTEVHINGRGPYRFLIDTGSQTSLLHTRLAAELGIQPTFRTELVNLNGSRLVPGTVVPSVAVQGRNVENVELLFHELTQARRIVPDVDGVLGSNILARFNFLLSPSAGELSTTDPRPAGPAIPFQAVDDRIVLHARMGSETLALVLDSGASHIVLFRTPEAMRKTHSVPSNLNTLDGARSVAATTWTAALDIGPNIRIKTLPAAIVNRPQPPIDGLIPASLFQKVFIDNARRELVLVRE